MEHGIRPENFSEALKQLMLGVERAVYAARQQGSSARMPEKLQVNGIYCHALNQFYVEGVKIIPPSEETTENTQGVGVTVQSQTHGPLTKTTTTVADPSTEDASENQGAKRAVTTKGPGSTEETTNHPDIVRTSGKDGQDHTVVEHEWSEK